MLWILPNLQNDHPSFLFRNKVNGKSFLTEDKGGEQLLLSLNFALP
jgi:hypothetical protein